MFPINEDKKIENEDKKIMNGDKRITPENLIHGGDIYTAKERLMGMDPLGAERKISEILDFSANLNPLGLPEGVKQSIVDSVDGLDTYPDPLCRKLTAGLSDYESVPAQWILCGNGAADLIFRTVFSQKPKKAMVLAPTFAEYEEALLAERCQVVRYQLKEANDYSIEDGLFDALTQDLDMLFLCNPNNPTGQLIPKEFLLKILQRCKALGILLFVDECFNEFLEEPETYSMKEYLAEFDNLIILKAFTKIYAMAGIRLGHCMTSNKTLRNGIRGAGQPWSVSILAQTAGIQAMEEKEYLEQAKKLIGQEREYLIQELQEHGIKVIASNANYIFLKAMDMGDTPLHERLFEKEILIRNCENYHGLGLGHYRICIKKHEENVKLIQALKEIKS